MERRLHRGRKQHDEQTYKRQWEEAIQLLNFGGQLTDEQVKAITPQPPGVDSDQKPEYKISDAALAVIEEVRAREGLPPMAHVLDEAYSEDRREVEIERAKHGLPPADTLEGMYSEDIREVLIARAQHASLRSQASPPPTLEQ